MKNAYNLCNVIEIFTQENNKDRKRKAYDHFKLQMALAQLCKTHLPAYVNIQIPPQLSGGID